MLYLILLSISILILINALMIYSIKKVFIGSKNENDEVNISIVIAAKNEAGNIDTLLTALEKLDYPSGKYEVIVIDDNSTDSTVEKLNSRLASMKNISVKELKVFNKSGKREALSFGISNAKYPHILITDADCHPQSGWLKACSKKFSLGYEMIFGVAPFYQHENIVNNTACFENLRSSFLSISLASIGLPYTAAARNFGFTKKAFESLGGYSKTKDTMSGDDDLLLREAVKKKMKIGLVTESGSFVYSEAKKTFKEYFRQKARHTQTSFHYLKKHQFSLGLWHLFNFSFLLSPLLMFFNPILGVLLPAKLLTDFVIVKSNQNKIGYEFSNLEIFYLQIFYEILLMVHFFNARHSEIKWK